MRDPAQERIVAELFRNIGGVGMIGLVIDRARRRYDPCGIARLKRVIVEPHMPRAIDDEMLTALRDIEDCHRASLGSSARWPSSGMTLRG